MDDPYRLGRFVSAQDSGHGYDAVLAELRAGAKVSHWMWYVFPQVEGLGSSAMAQQYAIGSLDEARAYLAHPVLRARLLAAVDALLGVEDRSITRILGPVDAMKLRSSMTLFAAADPDEPRFPQILEKYFHGQSDDRTTAALGM
ncbi:DUF1810 domain-containing protein [Cryptosporangium aurantiacum]|uniref:Uncharacterized protein, DUF1810 family n=1 Tax=Cryptosporangium aurantiacum TaxID=134849 RepID=A0A1M7KFT7_9ACTN|nr:DUF1810 domain-containing protein [Cryptosporangium aurantiacum]SHM63699.1 Uncharacterized protein, DUF1810 family [Cryptosporangium aurantiacum]